MSYNVTVYRTDELGTIVMISDGVNIVFDKIPGTYNGKQVKNGKVDSRQNRRE